MELRTSDCYREMLSAQPLILRIAEFFSGYSPPIFATLGIDVSTYYSVIMSPAKSILENWKIPNTIYKEIYEYNQQDMIFESWTELKKSWENFELWTAFIKNARELYLENVQLASVG